MIKEINGDLYHFKDGLLHNDQGPAIEYKTGEKIWMEYGKLHRSDGPAIQRQKKIWWEYWTRGVLSTNEEITNIKRLEKINDFLK